MYYEMNTGRLTLRPLDISDISTVHEYASDPENTGFMMFLPNSTVEETEAFLMRVTLEWQKPSPAFYEFAVVYEGRQIGAVSVMLFDDGKTGEMGWIINRNYWRMGMAYEAACAVREFAFGELKLTRLIAQCDAENEPSYRLMEKLGFVLEDADGTRVYAKTGRVSRELTYAINKN